jgi:tight adherence protein C
MIVPLTIGATVGFGLWMLALAIIPTRPSLASAIARLHRPATTPLRAASNATGLELVGAWIIRRVGPQRFSRYGCDLAVLNRPPELFAAHCAVAGIVGMTLPVIAASALTATGIGLNVLLPIWASLIAAAVGVVLVVARLGDAANEERDTLRLQLGAFLDVLSMLLAAAEADEQALQLAARAGDGRLFDALARAFRDAGIAGRPMLTGMHELGRRWELDELTAIAAAGSLASSDGAAVRRTLMAKSRSMRNAQLAEEETRARLQSSKLSLPQFLIAIGLIVLLMYPAVAGFLDNLSTTG